METLKDKLTTTLDGLGNTERTKLNVDKPTDIDKALHEFTISGFLRSYSENRYKKSKKNLIKALTAVSIGALDNAVKIVAKKDRTSTIQLSDNAIYTLDAQVNPGSSYLDEEGLKLALKLEIPNHSDVIDSLFIKHRKKYDPTVTYIVANKLEKT